MLLPMPPDAGIAKGGAPLTLTSLIDCSAPGGADDLAGLWGEIAVNPTLRAEHLRHDRTHHATIAQAAARLVGRELPEAEDKTLATARIALRDGIWLEFSIAPEEMSRDRDRAVVEALLQGAGRRAGQGMKTAIGRIRKSTAFPRPEGPRRSWTRSGIHDLDQRLPRRARSARHGRGWALPGCFGHRPLDGAGPSRGLGDGRGHLQVLGFIPFPVRR